MTDIREQTRHHLATLLTINAEKCQDQANLRDLAMNSFQLVEMAIDLQEEMSVHFSQSDLNGVATVGDLLDLVETRKEEHVGDVDCEW